MFTTGYGILAAATAIIALVAKGLVNPINAVTLGRIYETLIAEYYGVALALLAGCVVVDIVTWGIKNKPARKPESGDAE